MTTRFHELAARYLTTWNETDPAARSTAVRDLFAEDACYIDPIVEARGHDELVATIGAVHEQFPGFRFRLAGLVDGHHDQVRFTWDLGPEGTEAPITGFDVAVLDDAGRIRTVHGFPDRLPAA